MKTVVFSFSARVAASSSLGWAAARRPDTLADLTAVAPDRVTPLRLDITDHDRIAAAVDEVLANHGRVDVLVNNAGRGAGVRGDRADEQHGRPVHLPGCRRAAGGHPDRRL